MNPREAAKILGKSHTTIIEWCKLKKISATQKKSRGPGGKSWDISTEEVQRILKENETGGRIKASAPVDNRGKTLEQQQREQQQNAEEPPPDGPREIIGDKRLDRIEAERIIKQEEAIKKQRENLLRDSELVERGVVLTAVKTTYRELTKLWGELIDIWSIKYNFSQDQTKEISTDVRIGLTRFERKLKDDFEVEGIS